MTDVPLPSLPVGSIYRFPESITLDETYMRVDRERRTLLKSEYPELWNVIQQSEPDLGSTEDSFNLPNYSRYPVDGLQIVMRVK